MCDRMDCAGEILAGDIGGYHRYRLDAPACPDYVGRSLCEMLALTAEELVNPPADLLVERVHPEDRERYRRFLDERARSEGRGTLTFRLIDGRGRVMHVLDNMSSRRDPDGVMRGYATLTDVTGLRRENEEMSALSESLPCGIVKYTCEDTPRVTYVNAQMLRLLGMDGHGPDDEALAAQCRRDVYLAIAPEERALFKRFLDRVYAQDRPVAGEITALRGDGARVRLYGWILKTAGADGAEEFQSVCVDVTDRYDRRQRAEQQSYLRVLSQVYDEISELDPARKSIRFLQGRYFNRMGSLAGTPLVLEDALNHWLEEVVAEEDRASVRVALEVALRDPADGEPVQTEFRARRSDGTLLHYIGIILRTGGSARLFCCRDVTHQREADALRQENNALRGINDRMQQLVMRFTDGMLAFEIRGDSVRPLYFSENVCDFFGYDRDEWLASMQALTPIREFVSKCRIDYESFLDLLENREAEFHYTDVVTHSVRRMRAVCSDRDAEGSRYVILCDVTDRESATEPREMLPDVYIRTFGYFDVFVDGTPIAFKNEKAKELLALLADRRGGFVAPGEAIAALWEDEDANSVTLARYRKVALRLKNTLEEYGVADIVESVDGKRRIVSQAVRCDLYDYLSGDPRYAQLFKGSYLQNYSWGELTLAELSGEQ